MVNISQWMEFYDVICVNLRYFWTDYIAIYTLTQCVSACVRVSYSFNKYDSNYMYIIYVHHVISI